MPLISMTAKVGGSGKLSEIGRQSSFKSSSGTLVAEYDSQLAQNPQINLLTTDHLNSPRVITDGRGAVVARHDYMAYGADITETLGKLSGRTTAQGYTSADEVRKQYTGYERDDESGLDFAQARYYNSSHGRFTSVDPLTASATIKNPQTFNRYAYVLNSPYKFTDSLGLIPVSDSAQTTAADARIYYAGRCYGGGVPGSMSLIPQQNQGTIPVNGSDGNETGKQAPQSMLSEAIERIVSVWVTGGGVTGRTGIMEILKALTHDFEDAWVAGLEVGALAQSINGVILVTGGSSGEEQDGKYNRKCKKRRIINNLPCTGR